MRFFTRRGNYVRIDNTDLSNKIDVIKSEFIKKKHRKHQTKYNRKKIFKILKYFIWTFLFFLIILLINAYFFKDKVNQIKKQNNNVSKIDSNKKEIINLNDTQKKQKILNTNTQMVGNITFTKMEMNQSRINDNKTIIKKNELMSFSDADNKLKVQENKTIVNKNESILSSKKQFELNINKKLINQNESISFTKSI